MNYSGIIVICKPEQTAALSEHLAELPGVEVHYQDSAQGKVILVQEAESVDAEVAGIKRIKQVPGVIVADMVYHYFAEDPAIASGIAARAETAPRPWLSTNG